MRYDIAIGILLAVAGALGLIPVDARAGWACILAAGVVLICLRLFGPG